MPRRRQASSTSTANAGRFSRDSRLARTNSTVSAYFSRSVVERCAGLKVWRSTPSGTCVVGKPIRSNSSAANCVVQTMVSTRLKADAFIRSATRLRGKKGMNACSTPSIRS